MIKVKICGIRCHKDIEIMNEYKPDYAGFVFAPSLRQVSFLLAGQLTDSLDPSVRRVGVFVNSGYDEIRRAVEQCGIEIVQLHGDETPEFVHGLSSSIPEGVEVWKAIRIRDTESVEAMTRYNIQTFLLDAFDEKSYGGTGKMFNPKIALEAKKYGNIILAGGLNEHNVAQSISIVKPYAVDTSSGVEEGGFKSKPKVKNFIETVRGVKFR